MNARLSSLLVAGGVVLAGIQSGSLVGAIPDAGSPAGVPTLQGASFLPTGSGSVLNLAIPGFNGVPRLQVLTGPNRVVVDLPGVNRGECLSRKDLLAFNGRLILRSRLAQFATAPDPVTRFVLEVAPGTQVQVSSDSKGVNLHLLAGKGSVDVQFAQKLAPKPMDTEAVAARPAPVESPETPVMKTPEPVLLASKAEAPVQAAPTVALAQVEAPVQAAPAVELPQVEAPIQAAPAVELAKVEAPVQAAPAVELAQVEAPVQAAPKVQVARVEPSAPKRLPLTPVPSIGVPFHTLPSLALNALMPANPGQAQEKLTPISSTRNDSHNGRNLGEPMTHYTGTRMSLDVVNTDLVSLLRVIADESKMNLIADQEVGGTFTIKFTDTPWDQVLDVLLKNAGLGKEVGNGIIRVAKIEKLQKEEEDRKRLDDAKALAGEVQSLSRPLSFAKASEAKTILDKVLTKRGSLIVDERTNTLIIQELPRNIPLLDDLIAQLDVQIQQVQIEARVVEATKNFERAFGAKWPQANGGTTNLTTTTTTGTTSNATWGATNGSSWNSINNLPSATGNSAVVAFAPGVDQVTSLNNAAGQFWVSFLSNRMSLNVVLQALEKEGVVKIVSSPKVVTQNNKKARVLSGAKIPYPSQQGGAAGGAISVAFVDANLELDVTPQITNDGTIIMDIHVEKSDADFSNMVNGTPSITKKMVETQVLVKDGGTAIMGGVYKNNSSKSKTGVPFLSSLPIIGGLFRTTDNSETNDELLVFITPRILKY